MKIPLRVARIVERLRAGETLCKTIIHGRGGDVIEYHFEPSGDHAPFMSSEAAISLGLLAGNEDGILPGQSQTWRAKEST